MSNELKPLLSEEAMLRICLDRQDEGPRAIAFSVRSHYESLIRDGKLRLVDEVETAIDSDHSCLKCGHYTWDGYTQWNYCPGCGNKIKR